MNPAEWLVRSAIRAPESAALFLGTRMVASYSHFARRAGSIGASLACRGIGKGDRIAIFMGNRPEYLEAMYGVWFCGAAAIPINSKLHAKEAAWIIENAEASLILSDDKLAGALAPELGGAAVEMISADAPGYQDMLSSEPMERPVPLEGNDMVWLFYTSGTTGRPKGVGISARNMATMSYCYFVDVDEVTAEDAILYAAPMSHAAGIYNFMHVMRGSRHVVPESAGFDPAEILDLGKAMGPISMFAAPTMVRRLVDEAKRRGESGEGLRTISYAGGPMYEADILEAVEVMGPRFVQVYGQGECPMGITALGRETIADRTHPRWRQRLNSVGKAQSAVRVQILGEDGQELPRGEIGEIAVAGDTVMPGYWKNPEATDKTIKNGWLWTGDVGFMDEEGFVTLQDRSKDMIISGGSNIYPREVEEVLLAHPLVHEVAVVGRKHEDWGEEVVAFVVPQEGGKVSVQELDQLCLDQIARFKRPKDYIFIDALPKNNYGKVLKTDLRKRLES